MSTGPLFTVAASLETSMSDKVDLKLMFVFVLLLFCFSGFLKKFYFDGLTLRLITVFGVYPDTMDGITLASRNTVRNLAVSLTRTRPSTHILNKCVELLSFICAVSLKLETSCLRVMLKN